MLTSNLNVAAVLAALTLIVRSRAAFVLIFLAGLSLGAWRAHATLNNHADFTQWYFSAVEVRGTVAEDVSIGGDGRLRMRVHAESIDSQPVHGDVWVRLDRTFDIRRSDIVAVEGQLLEGFGNFPAAIYDGEVVLLQRPDYADIGRDVRDTFADGIRTTISEPEASLASGFLVGQKTALPEKLDTELRLLGLTHIVVASGYNLSILVRLARRRLLGISRFTSVAGAGLLVVSFMAITGASPSMSRASLVTGLSLIAWYYGRSIHPFVLISLSAAVTVLINPAYAWGDIGWLLSFTSFIGVIVLAPLLHAYFFDDAKPGFIRQVLFETLSAQILTLPIILLIFSQYSPLSLLANLLILPLISVVMALTFVAGAIGMLVPGLAQFAGFPAELVLRYMTTVVSTLARSPHAQNEVTVSWPVVVISYLGIAAFIAFLRIKSGFRFRSYNIVE